MLLQELKEKATALSVNERLDLVEAIVQSLKDNSEKETWRFLEPRAESWREQLYLKGKKLRASNVYFDMIANEMTPEESAEDWDLPVEAVLEAIEYCKTHKELIASEADKERSSLYNCGSLLIPPATTAH